MRQYVGDVAPLVRNEQIDTSTMLAAISSTISGSATTRPSELIYALPYRAAIAAGSFDAATASAIARPTRPSGR